MRDLALRCNRAGSGTAWPATYRDLLAAQGLALGIAVVVVGIAVAIVIAFVDSSAGAKPVSADKPASAQSHPGSPAPQAPQPAGQTEGNAAAAPPQGQNPETPTPTAAVQPPPVLKEGTIAPIRRWPSKV